MIFLGIFIQVIIGYNLFVPAILYIASSLKSKKIPDDSNSELNVSDYAIIVTAYEQTHQLREVILSLLELNYINYHVYVVADNCDVSTIQISDPKVTILKPDITLANNVRSHFYAIDRFVRPHDKLTIIDSDNLVHPLYLSELDRFFDLGFVAVQGVRKAKNYNTALACLDAARDSYYNYFDGQILFSLGSSATLAGSGMAFETSVYKNVLENYTISGAGFDKYLQAKLLMKNFRIAHSPDAIVYDEKTSKKGQLINQRARWINAWFKHFGMNKDILLEGIKNESLNQLLFGFVLLRPPLFLFLLGSLFCLVLNLFVNPFLALLWIGAITLFILSFLLALSKMRTPAKVYEALIQVPMFIFFQIVSLFYSRGANRRSVATKH